MLVGSVNDDDLVAYSKKNGSKNDVFSTLGKFKVSSTGSNTLLGFVENTTHIKRESIFTVDE